MQVFNPLGSGVGRIVGQVRLEGRIVPLRANLLQNARGAEMGKSVCTLLVLAGVGLLFAGPAVAGVVFSSDFEAPTYTSGAIPDTGTPQVLVDFGTWSTYKFPDGGTGIIGKPVGQSPQWAAGGYSSDPTEAGDVWLNDAFVSPDPVNAGNNMAAFVGSSSQGPINASGASVLVDLNTADDIVLSLQTYYPSERNAGGGPTAVMAFMSTSLNFGSSGYFGQGSLFFNFQGTSYTVTPDVWHTAAVTIHPGASTADFAIDGATMASDVAVNLGSFTGLAKFNVYMDDPGWPADNGDGAIFMDNVVISQVPEPASLSLLVLAGMGALLRRRK